VRDFEKERPVVKAARTMGRTTSYGKLKPYNELVQKLYDTSRELPTGDRPVLLKLAWALGEAGETHACEAIVAAVGERKLISSMWGLVPDPDDKWRKDGGWE
jgi:HEAT repeat protein